MICRIIEWGDHSFCEPTLQKLELIRQLIGRPSSWPRVVLQYSSFSRDWPPRRPRQVRVSRLLFVGSLREKVLPEQSCAKPSPGSLGMSHASFSTSSIFMSLPSPRDCREYILRTDAQSFRSVRRTLKWSDSVGGLSSVSGATPTTGTALLLLVALLHRPPRIVSMDITEYIERNCILVTTGFIVTELICHDRTVLASRHLTAIEQ